MSVLNTLPAPVVQMGLVEKIVDQQQNQPHALLQAGQEASRELLKAESRRVAPSDASERGRRVRDPGERQGHGQGSGHPAGAHSGQTPEQAEEGASDMEAGSPAANPWAGNLVNLKI